MDVDLNCDLGEGGAFDAELMPLITSANVACGFHAGDPSIATATLRLAARFAVRRGAHPSFPDRENFGRRELDLAEDQVFQDSVYQIGGLAGLAKAAGISLAYVKPHGALYNMAARDAKYARPVAEAAPSSAWLVGLPGSQLQFACAGRCLFVARDLQIGVTRATAAWCRVPVRTLSLTIRSTRSVRQWRSCQSPAQRVACAHYAFTATIRKRWLSWRGLRTALLAAGHRLSPFA